VQYSNPEAAGGDGFSRSQIVLSLGSRYKSDIYSYYIIIIIIIIERRTMTLQIYIIMIASGGKIILCPLLQHILN